MKENICLNVLNDGNILKFDEKMISYSLAMIEGAVNSLKVVVVTKISLWKKKFFYDFNTGNYIISRVICKERHSF